MKLNIIETLNFSQFWGGNFKICIIHFDIDKKKWGPVLTLNKSELMAHNLQVG